MDDYRRAVIECVKQRPVLWDPKDPSYNCKEDRKLIWEEIDDFLNPPPGVEADAKHVWHHLSRGFSNALRRRDKRTSCNTATSSGSLVTADSGCIDIEWRFERDMSFLIPAKQLRGSSFGAGNSSHPSISSTTTTTTTYGEYDMIVKSVHSGDENESSRCASRCQDECHDGFKEEKEDSREEGVHIDEAARESLSPDRIMGTFSGAVAPTTTKLKLKPRRRRKLKRKSRNAVVDGPGGAEVGVDDDQTVDRENSRVMAVDRGNPKRAAVLVQKEEVEEESPRLGFFLSLMPIVNSLDNDQFMDFQIDVIQALRKRRRAAVGGGGGGGRVGTAVPEHTASTHTASSVDGR